jgi:pimeloyl-ACP methyl ester carboxylesterase
MRAARIRVAARARPRNQRRPLEPLLAERFTVCAVDRRGRGRSGDSGNSYEIEQEFADVAAVVDSLTRPADLFGHSYGATVALGAALLARNLRRLVLYEPTPGVAAIAPELIEKLDALLARDLRDELLRTFMVELVGFGPDELEQSRASPLWAPRVAAAHTIPREIRAEERYQPDPDAFAALSIPVMLLLGSESPRWARRGTEIVQSLLSNSHVVVLQGQGHVATLTAPELLAGEVARFLHDA